MIPPKVVFPPMVKLPVDVIPPLRLTWVLVVAPRAVTEARVSASVADKLRDPPKETLPPPVKIPPVTIVMPELASSVLLTQPTQATSDAVIVPVPLNVNEAPLPTIMLAAVFIPLVIVENGGFPPPPDPAPTAVQALPVQT